MRRLALLSWLAIFFAPQTGSAADLRAGNWKLAYWGGPPQDFVAMIIKVEPKDDGYSASLVEVAKNVGKPEVKSIKIADGQIRLTIEIVGTENTFEGPMTGEKEIRGSWASTDRSMRPAQLIWTEEEKIDPKAATIKRELPGSLKKRNEMQAEIINTRLKLGKATEEEARSLKDDLAKWQKELAAEEPKLLQKSLEEECDAVLKMDTANILLRNSTTEHPSLAEARRWVEMSSKVAETYGPRYRNEVLLRLGEWISQEPPLAELAMDIVERLKKGLANDPNVERKGRYLNVAVNVLRRLGRQNELRPAEAQLEKTEAELDMAFLAKLPKIEVEPFAGRKNEGKRVVLMEMFTGAECPPCVAADYAFDLLHDAFHATELVQLQYHMHIPAPDPLTNSDTVARWVYYTKAFPKKVRGTPTAIFDGTPFDGGGGAIAASAETLKEYREAIESRLEEPAQADLKLEVARTGPRITIKASVSDLVKGGEKVKLRFALVESGIRYQGGNGLRHHHNVVRAMPGGSDGFALPGTAETREVSVDLSELRMNLEKYLDTFAHEKQAFPRPQRPMEFKKVKVIAYVQDDASHVIRQAVQADVPEN
ncbi:MAG: hypothetical protein ACJ8C4_20645 [Gemmataceae bacterium]